MSKHPPNWLIVQQQSAEWLDARLGHVTASRVADVVNRLKNGKPTAAYEDYKIELLAEALTGQAAEHYVSPYMDFGTEYEPVARAQYEMAKSVEVEKVGFILHPRVARSGASPDGVVGEDGLLEVKVPSTRKHIEYFTGEVVPDEYKPQLYWQMACAERKWCDFVSYDPRLPEEFGLFIVRLERDEKIIGEMEQKVEQFIAELNAMSEKLLARRREVPAREPQPVLAGPTRAIILEMA